MRTSWVGLAIAFAQAPALAQLPPAPVAETAPPTDTQAAASQAAPRETEPTGTIDVEDPMLIPVPPPTRMVNNWREALSLVKTRSTNYLRATAQVDVARAQSRMALARVLPTLTGAGQLTHHLLTAEAPLINNNPDVRAVVPDPRGRFNVGATLRVPLVNARNWYDYATSKHSVKQAEMSRDDAERQIIGGLAEALVSVVTAERLSEVTRVNLKAALSTLELNKRRTRLGAGSAVDVLRAEQEVARSRAQVVDADEALRQAREALGQALGYAEPYGVTPDLKMDQLRSDARQTCQAGTEPENRADVRAAAAGAAIAERNVRSVSYAFLPLIDFTSTINYNSVESFAGPHTTWTIGGTLTWHLYDGGMRYGERDLNRALLEQSRQDTVDATLRARLEASRSVRGVGVARTSLSIAEDSRSFAKDNARLARAKFMNGSGTSFDMVDTQRTAREAELDVTVKEFELLRAEIIAFLSLAACDL